MTIDELLKKASPRPWVVLDYLDNGEYGIVADNSDTHHIVVTSSVNQARTDLELIALAVNNFERMREALKKISEVDSTWFRDPITNDNSAVKRIAKEALEVFKP